MTSFHFGRKCPGRFLGENSLWIVAVSVLAAFDITRAVDEHGQEIMPDLEYATGVTRYLFSHFNVLIVNSSDICSLQPPEAFQVQYYTSFEQSCCFDSP